MVGSVSEFLPEVAILAEMAFFLLEREKKNGQRLAGKIDYH